MILGVYHSINSFSTRQLVGDSILHVGCCTIICPGCLCKLLVDVTKTLRCKIHLDKLASILVTTCIGVICNCINEVSEVTLTLIGIWNHQRRILEDHVLISLGNNPILVLDDQAITIAESRARIGLRLTRIVEVFMLNCDFCSCKVNDFIFGPCDAIPSIVVTVCSSSVLCTINRVVVEDLNVTDIVTIAEDAARKIRISYLSRTNFFKVEEERVDTLFVVKEFGRCDGGLRNIIQQDVRIAGANNTLKQQTIERRTSSQDLFANNIVSYGISVRCQECNTCCQVGASGVDDILQTEVKDASLILSSTSCLAYNDCTAGIAILVQVDCVDLSSRVATAAVGANQGLIKLIQCGLCEDLL